MPQLLYGTGNPAKLEAMRKRLSTLGIEVVGLKEIVNKTETIPDVIEDGKTPLENARKKELAYRESRKMPVVSCDSGL